MDSKQWQVLDSLFHEALEQPKSSLDGFIERVRLNHPDIVDELVTMLDSHENAGGFLSNSAHGMMTINPGDIVGTWRILKEIGRGGMSTVYQAERNDGLFERTVAIKFMHGFMPGTDINARIQAEQRFLARLNHPNIATLIDAGVSESGRPYFILEYIDGKPITQYCDDQKLNIDQRLQLFEQVCQAVQFAHQHLIVHRDLKPSNILVDTNGNVKLLDFGIAKFLDDDQEIDSPKTRTGLYLMTPEYASPEQVLGNEITTTSDVYALGMLLCELLTGSLPYTLTDRNPIELGKIITQTKPTKPSTLITQGADLEARKRILQHRSSSHDQLKRRLKGDLDTIVLTALRKEPERRYGSVELLNQDIQRYRNHLPISARPEQTSYRIGKFIQRHRIGVSIAALVAIALISITSIAVWQARQADNERMKALMVIDVLEDMLSSPNPFEDGRDVRVVDILEQTASKLETDFASYPDVQASVRHTLGVTYRELGLFDEASTELWSSLRLRNELYGTVHEDVANTQGHLGILEMKRGNYELADSLFTLAYNTDKRLFGDHHTRIATRLNDLGTLKWETGDYESAETLLRESVQMEEELRGPNHQDLAKGIGNLGILLSVAGKNEEALQLHERELDILRTNYDENHPGIPQALSHIGIILDDLERHEESKAIHEEALEMFRRIKGDDHPDVAYAMNNLATVMSDLGDNEGSIAMQEASIAIYEKAIGSNHPNVGIQYNNLAAAKRQMGDIEGAEAGYRKAVAIWTAAFSSDHPYIAFGQSSLGAVLISKEQYNEALLVLQDAYRIRVDLLQPDNPDRANTKSLLGYCLFKMGRSNEAEEHMKSAYETLVAVLGKDHRVTQAASERLDEFYSVSGRSSTVEIPN
jgi:serine/threonine-protein kinase